MKNIEIVARKWFRLKISLRKTNLWSNSKVIIKKKLLGWKILLFLGKLEEDIAKKNSITAKDDAKIVSIKPILNAIVGKITIPDILINKKPLEYLTLKL